MSFGYEKLSEVWLSLRQDGAIGSGSAADPYDASSPTLFDDRMNSFGAAGANTRVVHIGPGIFQTRGFGGVSGGWSPRSNWKIVGAGMWQTTLKLVDAPSDNDLRAPIGCPYSILVDGFEYSDLSLDGNMGGQPVQAGQVYPNLGCGGIFVVGRRLRLRRIRVINYGCQGPGSWDQTKECFVLYPIASQYSDGKDLVIDDCIVENPFPNSTGSVSPVIFGSGDYGNTLTTYTKGAVTRNCLLNFDHIDREVPIASISISGGLATATTKIPHGRLTGEWVVISGALINGSLGNTYNGSYQISNITPTTFTYSPVAYDTIKYGYLNVPTVDAAGEMYIGRVSSHRVPIKSLSVTANPPYLATLETDGPHNRLPGQNVLLRLVQVGTPPLDSPAFNKSFVISALISPTTLTFAMATNPGTPVSVTNAIIGSGFQALTGDTGIGTVLERNRVFGCEIGVYHDAFSTKDLWIRKNTFSDVLAAVKQNMGGFAAWPVKSLTNGGTGGRTATVETYSAHGLAKGKLISVDNAFLVGAPSKSPYYNGLFNVDTVLGPTLFSYIMTNDAGGQAALTTPPGPPIFGDLWQVGRLLFQKNLVDLAQVIQSSGYGAPMGLYIAGFLSPPTYGFIQVFVRGNFMNYLNYATELNGYLQRGMGVYDTENVVADDNVIQVGSAAPILVSSNGQTKCFNNQNAAGKLLQASNTLVYFNELENDIGLSLALLTSKG